MKKNILFYALMGAVIATMASCSHDSNEVLADAQKKPVIVEVSMVDAATRAGYEQGAFPTDLNIGMCFNYNDANEDTYESIISYNGGWVLTPQIYWPDYTGEIPYYAYAPYDESKTYNYGRVIHSVETDQTSLEKLNKSDLLTVQGAKKNTDEGILQLEFTHAHALLTMSFNVTDCTVTGVSIPNVAASIEDNIEDGTTEIAPQSETIYCYEEGDNKFCCFIPAQTIESDFRIMVTLSDGRELTYTHPEAITFTRNRITNFSLNVLEEISISSVTVEEWKNGGTIDAGQATEVYGMIDATNMTADDLNARVTKALTNGETALTISGITGERDTDNALLGELKTILTGQPEGTKISLSMPDLLSVGEAAFENCESLSSIDLPDATTIGKSAFRYSGLESIYLPKATSIGESAFAVCRSLESVHLPKVTTLGQSAFNSSHAITSMKFGSVITSLGVQAFRGSFSTNCDLQLAEGQKAFTSNYTITDTEVILDGTATEWAGYTWKSISKYVPDSK